MRLNKLQQYGFQAETWALDQLAQRGYQVILKSAWGSPYDILINGLLACEVKISRPTQRQVRKGYYRFDWGFDVSRLPKDQDSLVILVVDDLKDWYPFICPSWYFFGRHSTRITSHPLKYRGYLANCLYKWSHVDMVLAQRLRYSDQLMLPLFGGIYATV